MASNVLASPGGHPYLRPAITVKMVETLKSGADSSLHFADANKENHIMYIQQPKGLSLPVGVD